MCSLEMRMEKSAVASQRSLVLSVDGPLDFVVALLLHSNRL
jgi:hypothetical protein